MVIYFAHFQKIGKIAYFQKQSLFHWQKYKSNDNNVKLQHTSKGIK